MSERLIKTVEDHGVFVGSIIVNHVVEACDCDYCRRRAASQKSYIDEIKAKFGDEKQIAPLPSYGEEGKGEGLGQVARDLYKKGAAEALEGVDLRPCTSQRGSWTTERAHYRESEQVFRMG